MADEKLNPGQGEQIKLDISGESPGPDLTGEGPPAPEPVDVVVDTSKIDELMAKRRAAAREAVEQQADSGSRPSPANWPPFWIWRSRTSSTRARG